MARRHSDKPRNNGGRGKHPVPVCHDSDLHRRHVNVPFTESDKTNTPKWLENWWIWIGIAFALVIIAYTIPLSSLIMQAPPGSEGFKTW